MRKLASIQKIIKIEPIPGADRIEKATILGWECVVQKGQFKPGDHCIYFEIDSIVPQDEHFTFLESRKYRIKTAKFKNQIAQGLAMPFDILSYYENTDLFSYHEGQDVTDIIGVKKYEPEPPIDNNPPKITKNPIFKWFMKFAWFRFIWKLIRKVNKPFPEFVPKTDEERIQNIPDVFEKYDNSICYITEKLDGQSATYINYKKKFYICSRNLHLRKKDKTSWWEIALKLNIKKRIKHQKNIAIQGEIIGPKIQKNKYGLTSLEYYIFSIYDIDKNRYYDFNELRNFCEKHEFKMVPYLGHFVLSDNMNVQSMIDLSTGKSELSDIIREGIVIREHRSKFSFKAINPEFLINYDE